MKRLANPLQLDCLSGHCSQKASKIQLKQIFNTWMLQEQIISIHEFIKDLSKANKIIKGHPQYHQKHLKLINKYPANKTRGVLSNKSQNLINPTLAMRKISRKSIQPSLKIIHSFKLKAIQLLRAVAIWVSIQIASINLEASESNDLYVQQSVHYAQKVMQKQMLPSSLSPTHSIALTYSFQYVRNPSYQDAPISHPMRS